MDRYWAERIVEKVLEDVKATPHVGGALVPHGFTIGAIEATEAPNAFGGLSTWETAAKLSLAVIYSYTTEKGTHLPADRSNLHELRELLEGAARMSAHRVVLDDWIVEPEEGPELLIAPDAHWTVTAVFDVR